MGITNKIRQLWKAFLDTFPGIHQLYFCILHTKDSLFLEKDLISFSIEELTFLWTTNE